MVAAWWSIFLASTSADDVCMLEGHSIKARVAMSASCCSVARRVVSMLVDETDSNVPSELTAVGGTITYYHSLNDDLQAICSSDGACASFGIVDRVPHLRFMCSVQPDGRIIAAPARRLQSTPAAFNRGDECQPMASWSESKVQSWLADFLPTGEIAKFATAKVDGFALSQLTAGDMRHMGVTVGYIPKILSHVEEQGLVIMYGQNPVYDKCSSHKGKPLPVWIDFHQERLLKIDEESYEFGITFWLMESWQDDRVQFLPNMTAEERRSCKWKVRDTDICADIMWTPTADLGPGASKLNAKEWEILEERTFWLGPRFAWSVGRLVFVRASFNTPMSFVAFPFDDQDLVILFAYGSTEETVVNVATTSTSNIDPYLGDLYLGKGNYNPADFEDAPGWKLDGVSGGRVEIVGGTWFDQSGNSAHPFYGVPTKDKDAARLCIRVQRQTSFYIYNLVLPITMLQMLSWMTFLLSPSDIADRVTVVMTLLLALVAFQFVVNDSLPKSGEPTKMHIFITVSNVMMVMTGFESVLVYYMFKNDVSTRKDLVRLCYGRDRRDRKRMFAEKRRRSFTQLQQDLQREQLQLQGQEQEQEQEQRGLERGLADALKGPPVPAHELGKSLEFHESRAEVVDENGGSSGAQEDQGRGQGEDGGQSSSSSSSSLSSSSRRAGEWLAEHGPLSPDPENSETAEPSHVHAPAAGVGVGVGVDAVVGSGGRAKPKPFARRPSPTLAGTSLELPDAFQLESRNGSTRARRRRTRNELLEKLEQKNAIAVTRSLQRATSTRARASDSQTSTAPIAATPLGTSNSEQPEPKNVDQWKIEHGDGIVTQAELDNISRIDKACLVLFPLVFTIAAATVLRK